MLLAATAPNANTTISSGIPIDSTGTTKVSTKDTFNALWKNYYDEELVVLNDVSNKIKTVADAAKAAADDAKWAPMWQNNVFLSIPSGVKVGMRLTSPDVNMYVRLCRLSAGTYKSSHGIENIPTLLSYAAQQLIYFGNSCLLVGASTIVNWGDEFTVNVDTDVYVVFGTLRFFAQFKNSGSLTTTTTTTNRVWSINDVTIYRTVSEAVEATQRAVSALDYLKAALTDGSTEIAGGLTMTNVLMLKNLDGEVTAGMSGLTRKAHNNTVLPDNALMWGGGTYIDAFLAALSKDYLKEDGTPITTLLKKDGTGKIGVFYIDDDTVRIKTADHTTIITNKTINNSGIVLQSTTKQNIYDSKQIDGSRNQNESYTSLVTYNIPITSGKYNIQIPSITIYADVSARSYSDIYGNKDNGYAEASATASLRLVIQNNGTTIYQSSLRSVTNEVVEDSGNSQNPDTETIGTLAHNANYNLNAGTLTISLTGSITLLIRASEETTTAMNSYAYASIGAGPTTATIRGLDKYTVIAKDGIGIIANSDSSFYVRNDSSSLLNIIAKGLPTSVPTTTGQLYVQNGTLKIKT